MSVVLFGAHARAEDDQKTVQGTWVLVASERDGQSTPAEQLKARDVRMIFEDDRLLAKMADKSVGLGTFTLDPTASPKTYDRIYPDGSKRLGIYKIEGKNLTICVADLKKERPKDFGTAKGDGRTQVVYQRED
ncbi:TIGR03067 domain-containing protein [Singulisphaera sp. PoT]|uniref:TIGR03067 domain-containing protein n=1 Tax=Singulisphaera sp. PoT TaxID=3411797 RepID=UPI003BF61C57